MLTPVEDFWLHWHKDHGPQPIARRAQIVLLAASGAPPAAAAAALGVSDVTVTRAIKRFERRRLADFPRPVLSVEEVLLAAQVDLEHARQVTDLTLQLFEATRLLHHLPARSRNILSTAALLHNVALEIDESQHHKSGRELLLGMELSGYTDRQRRMIAYAVGFHRKKVKPEKAEGFKTLSPAQRRQTLALSALLRVADGLDYSQSQSTQLQKVVITPRSIMLHLSGPEAKNDAARAAKKADLWRALFKTELEVAVTTPAAQDLQTVADLPVEPQTRMPQFVRQIMACQWLRWQENEAAALSGDPAAVKAVRLSLRRLRAALDLFQPYLTKRPIKRLCHRLREIENLLSPVWYQQVLLADVKTYEAEQMGEPLPLQGIWQKEQREALAAARSWLSGPDAVDLQAALAEFIAAPATHADEPLRVGAQKVLIAILQEVTDREAAVVWDKPKTYHPLRLALKKCRYALEFFKPVLGPQVETVIADLVRAQDHLGAVSDVELLQQRLAEFLEAETEKHSLLQLGEAERILAYAQTRQADEQRHLQAFGEVWPAVRADRLRRRISRLLRALNPSPTLFPA
jgi:CHAD domain-containing protein